MTEAEAKAKDLNLRLNLVKKEGSKIKAFASFTADIPMLGRFAFRGVKLIEGQNGLFVSMPSQLGKDQDGKDKYFDHFYPITREGRSSLTEIVVQAYEKKLASL